MQPNSDKTAYWFDTNWPMYLSLLGCEQCKHYNWTGADWKGIYLNSQVTHSLSHDAKNC
jgi:uncharacterized protein with PIN domain